MHLCSEWKEFATMNNDDTKRMQATPSGDTSTAVRVDDVPAEQAHVAPLVARDAALLQTAQVVRLPAENLLQHLSGCAPCSSVKAMRHSVRAMFS
jgi:hypothetical protein